jgi:hypothetical protein
MGMCVDRRDGVVQLCVEYNADVNAQDEDNGGSPLMYAIHNSHDHIVDILLQLGAGMDQFEQQGYTPLMVACLSDNAAACERLLKNNTDLDQTDSKGRTALSMACRCVFSRAVTQSGCLTAAGQVAMRYLIANTAAFPDFGCADACYPRHKNLAGLRMSFRHLMQRCRPFNSLCMPA